MSSLIKRLIGLMAQGARKNQYYLEIGSYFLRKGADVKVGDVIKVRQTSSGRLRTKVITGLYFDFVQNKINHTAKNYIVKK